MAYGDKKKEAPQPLRDFDPMPQGKHKGEKMEDVPARYLMTIHRNKLANALVEQYILDNFEAIKTQAIADGYDAENLLD